MRLLCAIFPFFLVACDSPSPAMSDAPVARVSVAGSTFALRRSGDRVEILRISPEPMHDRRENLIRSLVAIQGVTGCGVREGSFEGDQSVARGELDCDGDKSPIIVRQVTVALDCEAAETWRIEGLSQDFAEVDCTLLPLQP